MRKANESWLLCEWKKVGKLLKRHCDEGLRVSLLPLLVCDVILLVNSWNLDRFANKTSGVWYRRHDIPRSPQSIAKPARTAWTMPNESTGKAMCSWHDDTPTQSVPILHTYTRHSRPFISTHLKNQRSWYDHDRTTEAVYRATSDAHLQFLPVGFIGASWRCESWPKEIQHAKCQQPTANRPTANSQQRYSLATHTIVTIHNRGTMRRTVFSFLGLLLPVCT